MTVPEEHQYRQFRLHFNSYYNPLCNYAFSFVKNNEISEDIVQDLFTRIWEDRRDLLSNDSLRYYLFTAVRNNCISYLRKEKRSRTVIWSDQEHAPGLTDTPQQDADKEYRVLLGQAIETLPARCKEVFLLSRIGNLSYKEIAASLGISVKTVENQLSKALKMLRSFLQRHGVYLLALLNLFYESHRG